MTEKKGHGFTNDQVLAFREAFNVFDSDGDGKITTAELGKVMMSLGLNPSEQELIDIINEFDCNGNKEIDFEEYLSMMSKQIQRSDSDSELQAVFKVFDQDGNGFIDIDELRQLLIRLGEEVSDEQLQAMMKEADEDGDGQVSFKEFKAMLSHK